MAKAKKEKTTLKVTSLKAGSTWTHEGRVVEGVRYEDSKYGYLPKWTVEVAIKGTSPQKWATREAGWESLGELMEETERGISKKGWAIHEVAIKVGNKIVARATCKGNKVEDWKLHHEVILVF